MATSAQSAPLIRSPAGPEPALHVRTRDKVLYWASTAVVGAVMVFSIINFTFNDHFPAWDPNGPSAFTHLGLPHWFKIELTLAKLLGVLALVGPGVPRKVREFAYFGFGLTLLSASIAHAASGDARITVLFLLDPLVFLGFLTVSYLYSGRVRR